MIFLIVIVMAIIQFGVVFYSSNQAWSKGYDAGMADGRTIALKAAKDVDAEHARFLYQLAEEVGVNHADMVAAIYRVRAREIETRH